MSAKFGPAGTAESFKQMGYKKTIQLGEYLEKFGLNHFEYQCGGGVFRFGKKRYQVNDFRRIYGRFFRYIISKIQSKANLPVDS